MMSSLPNRMFRSIVGLRRYLRPARRLRRSVMVCLFIYSLVPFKFLGFADDNQHPSEQHGADQGDLPAFFAAKAVQGGLVEVPQFVVDLLYRAAAMEVPERRVLPHEAEIPRVRAFWGELAPARTNACTTFMRTTPSRYATIPLVAAKFMAYSSAAGG